MMKIIIFAYISRYLYYIEIILNVENTKTYNLTLTELGNDLDSREKFLLVPYYSNKKLN